MELGVSVLLNIALIAVLVWVIRRDVIPRDPKNQLNASVRDLLKRQKS